MSEINWKRVAQQNNLTPEDFRDQILTTAIVLAEMDMEENDAIAMIFRANGYELIARKQSKK